MAESENGKGRSSPEEPLREWEEVTEGGHSLDEVARGLATGALSRRQALKMAGGALLGSMLGFFAIMNPAQAKKRKRRLRCIVGNIIPGGTDCPGKPGAFPCLLHLDAGTVGCCLPQNLCTAVAGAVAALDCTCGGPTPPPPSACSPPCPAGQCCNGGTCVEECPDPNICVAGACVPPPAAPSKCAGVTCPDGQCCSPFTGECISAADCGKLCGGQCVGEICDLTCPTGQCCEVTGNTGTCVEECKGCCNAVDQACLDACPSGSFCEEDFCTPKDVLSNVCPNLKCAAEECIDPDACACVARNQCDVCCVQVSFAAGQTGQGVCVEGCSEGQNCTNNICVTV